MTQKYENFRQVITTIGRIGLLKNGRLHLDKSLRNGTLLERDSAILAKARTFLPESQIEEMLLAYDIKKAAKTIRIIDPKREIVEAHDEYGNTVLASPDPFQQEEMYYLPATALLPQTKAASIQPKEPAWQQEPPTAIVNTPEPQAARPVPIAEPSVPISSPSERVSADTTAPVPALPIDYAALARQSEAPIVESSVASSSASPTASVASRSLDMTNPPAFVTPEVLSTEQAMLIQENVSEKVVEWPSDSQVYGTMTETQSVSKTYPTHKRLSIAAALSELGYGNVQAEEMVDPKLDQSLLKKGRITQSQAAEAQALSRRLKYCDVTYDPPNQAVAHLLDENTCRTERVFPYALRDDGTFIVLTDVPAKEAIIRTKVAERSSQRKIEVQVTSTPALDRLIREQYTSATTLLELNQELQRHNDTPLEANLEGGDNAVSRFVTDLIMDGMNRNASDIHIEPTLGGLQVRFRIDGKLRPAMKDAIAASGMSNIVRVVKLMARMDVGNNRTPQDNRISLRLGSRRLNLRVNSMPQHHGNEKIVLRLLKDAADIPEIEQLGIADATFERFRQIIRKPEGIFLVTGPTGSGKSFTLYATLKRIATADRNVQTLEDPIEYELPGINQSQVNPETGYTFAAGLRAAMRQDPDVILLGEIRDKETANISLSMANTGHQVLTTLHTISAAGAIQRLRDLGAENYNIAPSLQGVMAQRLVPKLCPACAIPAPLPDRVARILRENSLSYVEGQYRQVNHEGCPECERGRKGRLPIHELLPITPEIRELINVNASVNEIEMLAIRQGMLNLNLDGYTKVAEGKIGIDDLESILNDLASPDADTPNPASLAAIS